MHKLNKNQTGFGAMGILIVLVVIAVIGSAGYFVAKHADKTKPTVSPTTTSTTKTVTPTTSTNPYAGWKTYTNEDAGLTFQYPSNWSSDTTTDTPYNDGSFAGVQGTLTSPSGNPLSWVYQVIGGKGDAGCTPNAGDVPFTSTDNCASKQVFSVQQIPSVKPPTAKSFPSLFEDKLYITETKYYQPGGTADPVTSKTSNDATYQICLDPRFNDTPTPQPGTDMGFELPCEWWDTGFNVTFPVANQAGFNSPDAKTAILIMKSFNSL